MIILKTKAETKTIIEKYREQGKSIGFVPTMGALRLRVFL
jgi:pantothenate synthetase